MLSFLPGFEVARAIPAETITGLITGQYKLHGGVVRWAAGTENAGQIISHLIPASSNLASSTLTTLFAPVPVLSDAINSYQPRLLGDKVTQRIDRFRL